MDNDVKHRNELRTYVSPTMVRCPLVGSSNLNEQLLNGELDPSIVAQAYQISEKEVMEIAAKHRF